MSASIVGPFKEYRLVVDGWRVPLVEVIEEDGGNVMFLLDGRIGFSVPAAQFEIVADLVANAIAIALGLPCHPARLGDEDELQSALARLPHFTLAPRRLTEITSVATRDEGGDA